MYMFMAHSVFPSVWMYHPLQILQTQIANSGLTRPGRRAPQAQTQSVSFGGSINPATTSAPVVAAAAPAPVAAVVEDQTQAKAPKKGA